MTFRKHTTFLACAAGLLGGIDAGAEIVDMPLTFRYDLPRDFYFPQGSNSRSSGYNGNHWFVSFNFHPLGSFGFDNARPFSVDFDHTHPPAGPPHGEGSNHILTQQVLFAVPAGNPFDPPFNRTLSGSIGHGQHRDEWTIHFDHSPGSGTAVTIIGGHTPSPGPLALLGFGSLMACRRRR